MMMKFIGTLAFAAFFLVSCSGSEKGDKSGKPDNSGKVGATETTDKASSQNRGDTKKIPDTFESIVVDKKDSPKGAYEKALLSYNEGYNYEAINAAYRVLEKDPKYLPALLLSSKIYLKLGYPALSFYYIALYQDNGGEKNIGMALEAASLMAAGKIKDADSVLNKALTMDPDDPLLLVKKAQNDLHSGNFTGGLANCAKAVSLAGGKPEILKEAGDFYGQLGLMDSASQYYDKAVKAGEDDQYLKADVIEALISQRYFKRAEDLLEDFGKEAGESHRYYLLKSGLFREQGRFAMATGTYGTILPQNPKSPTVFSKFAWDKSRERDGLGSLRYFETALTLATIDSFPSFALIAMRYDFVDMLLKSRQFGPAGSVVVNMLDSFPSDFRAQYNAAYGFMMMDEKTRRDECLQNAYKVGGGNPADVAKLGSMYVMMKSYTKADEYFRQTLAVDKLDLNAILGEVSLARGMKRLSDAMAFLNGYDEYVSYIPKVAAEKLSLYQDMGENNSALQFAEQLISIAKEDLGRYKEAIKLALKIGDKQKVDELYQACIANNTDNPEAYALAGKYYRKTGDMAKARGYIDKALSLNSDHPAALTVSADLLSDDGKYDSAISVYRKVIEIDPLASDAIGGMALAMLERGDDPNMAANYVQEAIMYDGGNAMHRNTLGRAHYKAGNYPIARISFENALKFEPDNPDYNYYAGLNYIKDKKPAEAKKCLGKAIDLGLKPDLKSEAEKALRGL